MADPAYSNPNALVSTQWVMEHINDPDVRIVEVVMGSHASFGMPAYEAGHIPGELSPTGRTWHPYRCPLPGS